MPRRARPQIPRCGTLTAQCFCQLFSHAAPWFWLRYFQNSQFGVWLVGCDGWYGRVVDRSFDYSFSATHSVSGFISGGLACLGKCFIGNRVV